MSDGTADSSCNGPEGFEELEDYEMRRFDVHLQGPDESDERAHLFQDIARRFRFRLDQTIASTSRDQKRIRGLLNCCHEANARISTLRVEQNRDESTIDYLQEVNKELAERVSGISSSYVEACLERDTHRHLAKKWEIIGVGAIGIVGVLLGVVIYLIFSCHRFKCVIESVQEHHLSSLLLLII